jgi:two-component system sensor histidine kinase/response regulator
MAREKAMMPPAQILSWYRLMDEAAWTTWQCDPRGRLMHIGRRGWPWKPAPREPLYGLGYLRFLHPEDAQQLVAQFQRAASRGEGFSCHVRLCRPSGPQHAFKLSAQYLRNPTGQLVGWRGTLVSCNDLTLSPGKPAVALLATAGAPRVPSAAPQRHFLRNLGHGICTPLSNIVGLTDLLLDTPLGEQQRQFVMSVRTSGLASLTHLDDVLRGAHLDGVAHLPNQQPFGLAQTVAAQAEAVALEAHSRGLTLRTWLDPALPDWFVGDSGRVGLMLRGLLAFAVRGTARGTVCIDVAAVPETTDATGGAIVVNFRAVSPPFEASQQTANAAEADLVACAQQVHALNGTLQVIRKHAQGAHVQLALPLHEARRRHAAPSLPSLAGRSFAVWPADADSQRILRSYLQASGASVVDVANVTEALKAVARGKQQGCPIDAILVDADVPNRGCQVLAQTCRQRRHSRGMRPQAQMPPVVQLTGYGTSADVVPGALDGFALLLTWPVRRRALIEGLAQLPRASQAIALQPRPRGQDEVSLPAVIRPAAPTYRGRILVADDDAINMLIIRAQLRKLGLSVTTVSNGRTAVQVAAATPFDLILMDCHMPEFDGYAATQAIRAQEAGSSRHTPIVALTANIYPGNEKRCRNVGMDGYIAKPVDRSTLHATLNRWLGMLGSTHGSAQGAVGQQPSDGGPP